MCFVGQLREVVAELRCRQRGYELAVAVNVVTVHRHHARFVAYHIDKENKLILTAVANSKVTRAFGQVGRVARPSLGGGVRREQREAFGIRISS